MELHSSPRVRLSSVAATALLLVGLLAATVTLSQGKFGKTQASVLDGLLSRRLKWNAEPEDVHLDKDGNGQFFTKADLAGVISNNENSYTRPASRPQFECKFWFFGLTCSSGYAWRDVTVGPSCPWYTHKCIDATSYRGESCGFPAKKCVEGLDCGPATEAETKRNAHPEACH